MCVVALALQAHPRWRLVMAGNRDEFHARPAAAMTRWEDGSGIIAGRDLTGGGTWAGVSEAGRLAVLVNVRGDPPDPAKRSRGGLVTGALGGSIPADFAAFNNFAMFAVDSAQALQVSNIAEAAELDPGLHSLSNGRLDQHWPRKTRLEAALAEWLTSAASDPEALLEALADEVPLGDDHAPVFIRDEHYGTRASTVIAVDSGGEGIALERGFGPDGLPLGEACFRFRWPHHA